VLILELFKKTIIQWNVYKLRLTIEWAKQICLLHTEK
jgi:hypothetical protein